MADFFVQRNPPYQRPGKVFLLPPYRARVGCCLLAAALIALPGCHAPSLGRASSAARSNEALLRKTAEAHARYSAGVVFEFREDVDSALVEFERAAMLDPGDETMILDVSRRFLHYKKPEKALEVLQAAALAPGASGAVFARLGVVYAQLGRADESLKASRTAIATDPKSLAGYQTVFLIYLQQNQTAEALAVLDQAEKVKGVDAGFLAGLADLYLTLAIQQPKQKAAAHARALGVLERAEKAPGGSTTLNLKLAEGFQSVGARDRATALYAATLKTLADSPEVRERVRAKLAEIYLRGSDRSKAVELLEEIAEDDPTNAQAQFFLGSLAYEDKRFEVAVDHLGKAVLLMPDFEQAYYDLAAAHLALDKPASALEVLDRARAKWRAGFLLEYLNGTALIQQKAYRQAVERFIVAEIIAEASAPERLTEGFYFQLGAAHERNGDSAQAERCFEKALAISPSFAEAQNYLGYMWVEQGRNLDKAFDLIQKAVDAEPENAAFLDSLGWALFKLGKPAEALKHIEKAVRLNKEPDATLYDHLGDIHQALGHADQAREAWKKSVDAEDNPVVRRKLEGK
jgi:tetratricopeptide (TPR) repeat protein